MLEMELLVFELLNQRSDDLGTIEFVPRRSPDVIAEIIKQLEMSRGENELDTLLPLESPHQDRPRQWTLRSMKGVPSSISVCSVLRSMLSRRLASGFRRGHVDSRWITSSTRLPYSTAPVDLGA